MSHRETLTCSEPLFNPNFEPSKTYNLLSHFLALHGPDYFFPTFKLISYVLALLFSNSDELNFDESKSLRIEIRNNKQFQNILELGRPN